MTIFPRLLLFSVTGHHLDLDQVQSIEPLDSKSKDLSLDMKLDHFSDVSFISNCISCSF